MIGETLGGYRITRKLGEGGMGVVYEAEHLMIGRRAAIKCLLPELSNNLEACGRFFIEARAAALISHPSLVDIYDSGHTDRGSAYIIMEFLDGEDLGSYLRREQKIDVRTTVAICRQVASALGAVHQKGIIHRDLKPDNLFLVKTAVNNVFRVKVLDFGIAKLTGPENKDMSVKTRTGSVLGTPSYMSPEQCRGHGKVDWRSDIYALACIMYEMLVGHPPFQGSGYGEVLAQHIYEQPQPIRQIDASLPEGLEALLLRMLAKNPDQRLQTMEEFANGLDSIPQLAGPQGHGRQIEQSGAYPMPMGPPQMHAPQQQTQPQQQQKEPERTTLRGTASEKVPKKPGKRGLGVPLAVGGVIVLGVAGIVVATRGGASAGNEPRVAANDPPFSATTPSPTPSFGGLMPKPDEPKPAEPKPAEPKPAEPPAKPPEEAKAPEVVKAPEPPPKPAEEIKPAEPPKPVEEAKAPEPKPTPTAITPPPAPPVPPPAPAPAHFQIDSEPAGADVFRDGTRVGKTPLATDLAPHAGKVAFVVKLKGYKDATVNLPGDKGGTSTVKLVDDEPKQPAIKVGQPPKKGKPVKDGTINPFAK